MHAPLSKQVAQQLPIFEVAAPDQGKHPPVGLDRPVCVVGRKDYVNLPLPGKEVSKLHALIVREQRRVYLRDLSSTNGVEVNGEPVREVGLSDADIVRIGSFTLRCRSGFGRDGRRPGDAAQDGDGERTSAPPAELRGAAGNFSFPPERHTLLIGQRKGCDARLQHPTVAPIHAVVFEMDGRHYVQSFMAEPATRLNGRPIHREALQPGDELSIGQVALRYALVDLAAESTGAAAMMTDTGESLIQPAFDSSVAPAIDPSHHGELEPEDADLGFEVIDSEESPITPAMESSIAPAVPAAASSAAASSAAAAGGEAPSAPTGEHEDYGLDIEPRQAVADAAPDAPQAKPTRPAEPPLAAEPVVESIDEPVIEPVVERAMESGIAAAVEPSRERDAKAPATPDRPTAEAGAAAAISDDPAKSMHDDHELGDVAPLDLEPLRSSSDLEPVEAHDELDESFRANLDAARKKRHDENLSATYDEDSELEPIDIAATPADDQALSASFDEDGGAVPLTEQSDHDALPGGDELDAQPQATAPADGPPEKAVSSETGAPPPRPARAPAQPGGGSDDAEAVDSAPGQAAKLSELAKKAGLRDEADSAATATTTVEEITTLVEEVAESAQVLRQAWMEFQSRAGEAPSTPSNGDGAASPPTPPTAQNADQPG